MPRSAGSVPSGGASGRGPGHVEASDGQRPRTGRHAAASPGRARMPAGRLVAAGRRDDLLGRGGSYRGRRRAGGGEHLGRGGRRSRRRARRRRGGRGRAPSADAWRARAAGCSPAARRGVRVITYPGEPRRPWPMRSWRSWPQPRSLPSRSLSQRRRKHLMFPIHVSRTRPTGDVPWLCSRKKGR